MAKFPTNLTAFNQELATSGLICFGALELSPSECANGAEKLIGSKALLIGNAGTDMWQAFSKSAEYLEGKPDPMNRWTRRVLDALASRVKARAVYPFDEPYWPFQRIAQKAAGTRPSPLGILIHPDFGLFHAFRGMFIFDETHELMSQINALVMGDEELIHPCDACVDKPCLSACPVGAFTGERLDVKSCFGHLDSAHEPHCMDRGCHARNACPVGIRYKYNQQQIQLHMKSYRGD